MVPLYPRKTSITKTINASTFLLQWLGRKFIRRFVARIIARK